MAKIKLLTDIFDTEKKVNLEKGVIGDYGKERNERAVKKGYAEWVETEKKEAEPKKEATVKGKKIETK